MKQILLYKQIDFWAQVAAALVPVIISIITGEMNDLFITYLTVGAVQLASVILNRLYLPKFIRAKTRIILEITTAIIAAIFLLCLVIQFFDAAIVIAVAMLFVGGTMAVWYFVDTCTELQFIKEVLRRKAMDTLKQQLGTENTKP